MAPIFSHITYIQSFSRLQIPVASHRHFSSLARRLGRIFAHAYFHHREAFEQAEAESSLYARFLALTERFDLVPAEFLVIPTDGHNVGIGDSLGPPPSRSPRDENRRSNEFDRGYHQQQQQQQQQQPQQRTRYDLDLANFHHSNFPERNPSPPGPSSSDTTLGGIGESPSPSTRARIGRTRTGTMVFAEAEANTVTDELAARSSLREREQDPQKMELLERNGEPMPLKTVEPAWTGNTAEIAVLPSAPTEPAEPAEPEPNVSIPHSSTKEEPAEPTVSLTEVKSEDSLETQSIPTETTTDYPPVNDNVSIPEPALVPKETPETPVATQEVATKVDAVDDKETIPPSVINDSELPTIEASVDEMPIDTTPPEATVEVEEVVSVEELSYIPDF